MTEDAFETAPEPIDYREAAWLWMSDGGSRDNQIMLADFATHTVDHIADEGMQAWANEPGPPLDRAKFIAALEALRTELRQSSAKPGDPP